MFCLPFKLEFYTLLYHALLFHENLSNKHRSRINNIIRNSQALEMFQESDVPEWIVLLKNYFNEIGCKFISPNDNSMFFNSELLNHDINLVKNNKRIGRLRHYLRKIIRIRTQNKKIEIIFFSFLNNEIDIVFGLRFRFSKKEIRLCIGNRRKYRY